MGRTSSRFRGRSVAAAAVAAALVAVPAAAQADGDRDRRDGSSSRLEAVGLAGNGTQLVDIRIGRPEEARDARTVTGLVGDTRLVGIDYRVQDGRLYGVGDAGGVYRLTERRATAEKVQQLTVALDGSAFGVDFNPAANALRIVSDRGQNLRQPFGGDSPGVTVEDGRLAYVPAGAAPAVTAAAYTNNDLSDDTATTLFDIDTGLDQVVLQSPANSGQLVPTARLGVDATGDAGFDIYSRLRGGRTTSVDGYAVLTSGGVTSLYSVDVLVGEARRIGRFRVAVTDLAVELDRG